MNREKYPNYFLMGGVLYAIIFLAAFSFFIMPSLGFGFAYAEFVAITLLMFVPMLLLIVYNFVPNIQFLWGKEKFLRILTTAFILADFFIVLVLMLFLM